MTADLPPGSGRRVPNRDVLEALFAADEAAARRPRLMNNSAFGLKLASGQRRYWIYRLLGSGGQGQVYAAWDWTMRRFVALKFVQPESVADAESRASQSASLRTLGDEAGRAGEASASPNVVTVYELANHHRDLPYIVMQYAAGGTLGARVKECKESVQVLVRWLQQVASGLAALHESDRAHGDIKPANILLVPSSPPIWETTSAAPPPFPEPASFRGGQLDAKLADFGLAGKAGERRGGTPAFIAPEVRETGEHRPRSDVYSLGMTACDMLTDGSISAANLNNGMTRVLSEEQLARIPGVSKDLAAVVAKAVADNPAHRFASAKDMAEELNRVLLDAPLSFKKETAWQAAARWRRRNRQGFRLAALSVILFLAVLVAAGVVWNSWTALQGEQHERLTAQRGNARLLQDQAITEARFGDAGVATLVAAQSLVLAPQADASRNNAVRRWIAQMRMRLTRLRFAHGGEGELRGAAVCPERGLAIVGTTQGVIRYIDLKQLSLLTDPRTGEPKYATVWDRPVGNSAIEDAITCLAFRHDGKQFAATTLNGGVHVFDTDSGERRSFKHNGRPMAVAYNSAGDRLAVAAHSRTVAEAQTTDYLATYDLDGTKLETFPVSESLYAAEYSKDGKWLACCGEIQPKARVTLFPLTRKGDLDGSTPPTHLPNSTRVFMVAFSPDSSRLATGDVEGSARVVRISDRTDDIAPIQMRKQVRAVAFSPDGRLLLTGSEDRTARIWDLATQRPVGQTLYHLGTVRHGAIISNEGRVMTADLNGEVRVWDLPQSGVSVHELKHPGPVWDVAFDRDGKSLITGCLNSKEALGAGWVWNWAAETSVKLAHGADTQMVRFRPDEPSLAVTGGNDGTVKFWDARTGRERKVPPPIKHGGIIMSGSFSTDGRFFAFGGRARWGHEIAGWDFKENRPLRLLSLPDVPPNQVASHVWNITFSEGGRMLTDGGPEARLWSMPDGRLIRTVWHTPPAADGKKESRADTYGIISRDGRWALVAARQLNKAVIWDLGQSDQTPITLEDEEEAHRGEITALAFQSSGSTVAIGSAGGAVSLWFTNGKRKVPKVLRHESAVEAIAFSEDGKYIGTGTAAGIARVWSAETGEWTGGLWLHQGAVRKIAFSPDSTRLATAGRDGYALVCRILSDGTPVPPQELLRDLESECGIMVQITPEDTSASYSPPRPLSAGEWADRQHKPLEWPPISPTTR